MDSRTATARSAARKLLPWLFGLAPIALFLLSWSEELGPFERQVRTFALPVLLAELAVILIVTVVAIARHLRLSFQPTPIWACLGALVALAWATASVAPNAPASIVRTTLWMIHLLFGLSVAHLAAEGWFDAEELVKAVLAGFMGFAALLVIFAVGVDDPNFDWVNALPAYSNIRWFGYYAAAVVGLSAWGFAGTRKWPLVVAAVAFATALWTGSRGAVVASIGGFAVATFVVPALRRPAPWLRLLACLLGGVILSLALGALIPINGQGVGRVVGEQSGMLGGSGRVEIWIETFGYIQQRPWFGWGEAQFAPLLRIGFVHPHNIVMQVLLAWGLVGATLIGALTLRLARLVVERTDKRTLPLLCATFVIAAFSLIDGALYHVQSVALFTACVAAACALPGRAIAAPADR